MEVTGMLYGSTMLNFVGFPTAEVLGPGASEEDIKALLEKHGLIFIKPVFKGGVGKKGKAGLIGRAKDLKTALKEKERLYFVEHRHGNQIAKANGVTFEGAVPAEQEVYFSITDSTHFRAPTMTLTHHGGMGFPQSGSDLGFPLRAAKVFTTTRNTVGYLPRAVVMLTAQTRAVGGKETFTPLDQQHCRLLFPSDRGVHPHALP